VKDKKGEQFPLNHKKLDGGRKKIHFLSTGDWGSTWGRQGKRFPLKAKRGYRLGKKSFGGELSAKDKKRVSTKEKKSQDQKTKTQKRAVLEMPLKGHR